MADDEHERRVQALLCGLGAFVLIQLGIAGLIDAWLPQLRSSSYAVRVAVLKHHLGEPAHATTDRSGAQARCHARQLANLECPVRHDD